MKVRLISSQDRTLAPQRGVFVTLVAAGLASVAAVGLGGCSAGVDSLNETPVATQTDLDTTRPPPQTVTSTPLLPPVPETPAAPPPSTAPAASTDAAQPPLQYDHLYSEDEQLQIKTDLAKAAAKAKGD